MKSLHLLERLLGKKSKHELDYHDFFPLQQAYEKQMAKLAEGTDRSLPFACLFADSPEKRVELNRQRGVSIGANVFLDYCVWIEYGVPESVSIDDHVVIAAFAKIIGHDSSLNNMFDLPIYRGPVHLGWNCYVGSGAIILPGVSVGKRAIVGAGSVVTKDVPDETIVAGVPARPIGNLEEFKQKHERQLIQDQTHYMALDSAYRPV